MSTRITAESLEADIRARGGSVTLVGSVTATTLADVLGVSVRTLEGWRAQGIGPPSYTSSGGSSGRHFYRLSDVATHLQNALDADQSANARESPQRPVKPP